jgi:hypothetical protein
MIKSWNKPMTFEEIINNFCLCDQVEETIKLLQNSVFQKTTDGQGVTRYYIKG